MNPVTQDRSFLTTLKQGAKDARIQLGLVLQACKIAPLYFRVFMIIFLMVIVGDFGFLAYLAWKVTRGPISHSLQLVALFGAPAILTSYLGVAGPMLQFWKTHGALPEVNNEAGRADWKKEWKQFHTAFWLFTVVGAGALGLFTWLSNLLTSEFHRLGLLSTVMSNAAATPAQVVYWQIATFIVGWATRKRDDGAEQARREEREARKGIPWSTRRENSRRVPFRNQVWGWMLVGILLWLIPAALVWTMPWLFSGALRWGAVVILPVLVIWGVKLIIELVSAIVQHWARKGYRPALWLDYLWVYTLARRLQFITIPDNILIVGIANGLVTLLVDVGLGNHDPLLHQTFFLVLSFMLGLVISALMADAPSRADQALEQAMQEEMTASGAAD